MKLNKNYDNDLNRKRGLYFILGLLLILTLSYIALEWKSDIDTNEFDVGTTPSIEVTAKDSKVALETKASN